MYERPGGSMSNEERLASWGANKTHMSVHRLIVSYEINSCKPARTPSSASTAPYKVAYTSSMLAPIKTLSRIVQSMGPRRHFRFWVF